MKKTGFLVTFFYCKKLLVQLKKMKKHEKKTGYKNWLQFYNTKKPMLLLKLLQISVTIQKRIISPVTKKLVTTEE